MLTNVRLVFLCIAVAACSQGNAQVAAPEGLSDVEQAALQSITEKQVLGTVSFLASDEMAGRNTPSTELTIASAYVSARFRGAGLEPLGDDNSYFQTYQMQMSKPP